MNAEIILNNNVTVGQNHAPYFIAEANTSHFGDVDKAKEMAKMAKRAGADCIKFQSWSESSLYSQNYYVQNPITKRFVKKFSFDEKQLLELASYCREINIDFASTPYSKGEVDFLVNKCNVPFIKIASMDINNFPFIRHIASSKSAIVLSTGMADLEEIKSAVEIINSEGNENLCILHCVSIYPAPPKIINLNNISLLQRQFPKFPIGFSDHTLGIEISPASIALGSSVIEKHITLDKTIIGMDNQMALEENEYTSFIEACNNVYVALGSYDRSISPEEYEQRTKMRRSLVAAKDIEAGTIISADLLDAKRPGTGIPIAEMGKILGKTIKNDIKKDYMILPENII